MAGYPINTNRWPLKEYFGGCLPEGILPGEVFDDGEYLKKALIKQTNSVAIMSKWAVADDIYIQTGSINPQALYILIKHACDQVILPYEYAQYLIYFSFGLIPLKDFMKLQGVKMIVSFFFVLLILLPFWRVIGFLFV